MKKSRNGSVSLNQWFTPVVKLPSAKLSAVNAGKDVSSRFSNSENVLRGKKQKTMTKPT